jgi:hypothetical protein
MFRESEKTKQANLWKDPRLEMGKRTQEIFDDSEGWHNRFRREVTNRVDEEIFKPLFKDGVGAPNSPIRILVAMMALKEGQGISEELLYGQARFNALVRRALGLIDSDGEVPTESTYYLFRQRCAEYEEGNERNLQEEAFGQITKEQCQEYKVSGKRIRMDSKLLGSNIALYSRYGIVHETIRKYCAANGTTAAAARDGELGEILKEKAETVTYRSTKEEVARRLEGLGKVVQRLVAAAGAGRNKEYGLLRRVFEEQYEEVGGPWGGKKKRVKVREKSGRSGKSVQKPHDEDSEYRDKGGNKVKWYSVNVTETCDEGSLNLIVVVRAEGSGTADVEYLQEGIGKAQKVVAGKIEGAYTDWAYHSPDNQEYCRKEHIDWVLRGIQGKPSRYDLSFDAEGNMVVVNRESGERLEARKTKRRDPEAPERWAIKDWERKPIYFERKDVESRELRKRLGEIPKERLDMRNNVEATIFQVGYHYRGDKSRYRGLMKHRMWAISRCLWVNFRRIQLWSIREADKRENNVDGIPVISFIFNFFRRFLQGIRVIFWPPVFVGSC